MSRELRGKLAAILVSPQQLSSLTVSRNADDAKIGFRVAIHILKIFASAGDYENLAYDSGGVEAQRNCANHMIQIQVLSYLILVQ